ncbi:MAG: carbon storage regulator CsrA [Verrucomicrobia bacterium]|nr:carbon storage regulator CsrA [Verrucomicrobiota bacterium]
MLVLDRKVNQSIMIGNIEVVITEVRGDHVKVGVQAPRCVPVHRKEVYELIRSQNVRAAESLPVDLEQIQSLLQI